MKTAETNVSVGILNTHDINLRDSSNFRLHQAKRLAWLVAPVARSALQRLWSSVANTSHLVGFSRKKTKVENATSLEAFLAATLRSRLELTGRKRSQSLAGILKSHRNDTTAAASRDLLRFKSWWLVASLPFWSLQPPPRDAETVLKSCSQHSETQRSP